MISHSIPIWHLMISHLKPPFSAQKISFENHKHDWKVPVSFTETPNTLQSHYIPKNTIQLVSSNDVLLTCGWSLIIWYHRPIISHRIAPWIFSLYPTVSSHGSPVNPINVYAKSRYFWLLKWPKRPSIIPIISLSSPWEVSRSISIIFWCLLTMFPCYL